MRSISPSLRQFVFDLVDNRCEYCGLSQTGEAATFHVDHVIPLAEGGQATEENLALACVSCSLRKAARLNEIDMECGVMSRSESAADGRRLYGQKRIFLAGSALPMPQALFRRQHVDASAICPESDSAFRTRSHSASHVHETTQRAEGTVLAIQPRQARPNPSRPDGSAGAWLSR